MLQPPPVKTSWPDSTRVLVMFLMNSFLSSHHRQKNPVSTCMNRFSGSLASSFTTDSMMYWTPALWTPCLAP